jgi:hypothetical protein
MVMKDESAANDAATADQIAALLPGIGVVPLPLWCLQNSSNDTLLLMFFRRQGHAVMQEGAGQPGEWGIVD